MLTLLILSAALVPIVITASSVFSELEQHQRKPLRLSDDND